MTYNRPTYKDLMADIESGKVKVKDIEYIGVYDQAKLYMTEDVSIGIPRQAK